MPSKREDLLKAKSYVLYYGHNKENELSNFDLAIVEPSGHNPASVKELQSKGTIVIAYLSVMEIHTWSPEFKILKEEDFLKLENTKLINHDFGTYILDLTSKRWNSILLHNVGRLLLQHGYDGVFLDTIGDVEMPNIPPHMQDIQVSAAVGILNSIRNSFPEAILIQNNGLEKLCLYTTDYIDGLCWENPPLSIKASVPWTMNILNRLDLLKQNKGIRILLLTENELDGSIGQNTILSIKIALEKGFLHYCASKGYVEGIRFS